MVLFMGIHWVITFREFFMYKNFCKIYDIVDTLSCYLDYAHEIAWVVY